MKKFSIIAAALCLMLSLMGCGIDKTKDNAVNDKATDQTESNLTTDDNVTNNEENRLNVEDEAADRNVKMEEVESANVLVTNHNAYVAVVFA